MKYGTVWVRVPGGWWWPGGTGVLLYGSPLLALPLRIADSYPTSLNSRSKVEGCTSLPVEDLAIMISETQIELQRKVSKFLNREISLGELEDWLLPELWELNKSEDICRSLAGHVSNLIAEQASGSLPEESFRSEMASAIRPFHDAIINLKPLAFAFGRSNEEVNFGWASGGWGPSAGWRTGKTLLSDGILVSEL